MCPWRFTNGDLGSYEQRFREVANSSCPGQEKRMIAKVEVQIGDSGW